MPALDGHAPGDPDERLRAVHARIHERAPVRCACRAEAFAPRRSPSACCRSRTFGVLRHIDYLSTVSGGGYIGGSLTTWLHREGPEGRDDVMRELDPARAAQVGSIDEPSPVDRVRSTCRYLAPRGGVVSADVWALVIPILFPPLSQSREGQGRTNQHGAMGVIRYSAVDGPGAPAGTILYLKATLSGDEPVDVRNFAAADPLFPHDSTSNQFFEEARFESTARSGFTRCCQ